MDFEGALRARLIAAAPVTAIAGQRIYWEERPQASSLPAITLLLASDPRAQHMGGFQSVRDAQIQIDVWGTSFAQKKAMKEAVISALSPPNTSNGIRFQAATDVIATPRNERLETQMIWRDMILMRMHFSNA